MAKAAATPSDTIRFADEVYKGRFLAMCGDPEDLMGVVREMGLGIDREDAGFYGRTIFSRERDGSDLCIVLVDRRIRADADAASVLAHEAHHAAHYVLAARGVSPEDQAGETGAYYLEWIMRHLQRLLR